MDKLVSVIVPIYNMAEMIERNINQLLEQTYDNLEIVLVDDGSEDNVLEVCNRIAKLDKRVSVIHQENRGVAAARNNGIDFSHGKYIYFMDIDDEVERNTIEEMVSVMEKDNSDLVVCGFAYVDKNGETIKTVNNPSGVYDGDYVRINFDKFGFNDSECRISGNIWNKLYKSDIIKNNNLRFPKLRRNEDAIFNLDYINYISKISFCGKVYYKYYVSSAHSNAQKYFNSILSDTLLLISKKLEYGRDWNNNSKAFLEKLCREFAVNIDFYMQMVINDSRDFNLIEKYKCIKETGELFNAELPTRDLCPDFLKYKLMLKKKYLLLFIVEYIKRLQLMFREKNYR